MVDGCTCGIADRKVCALGQLGGAKGTGECFGFCCCCSALVLLFKDDREGDGEGCGCQVGGYEVQLLLCGGGNLAAEKDEEVFVSVFMYVCLSVWGGGLVPFLRMDVGDEVRRGWGG